jgi:NADPH:quinone reductase-like Zn-dependent oxidoreductase
VTSPQPVSLTFRRRAVDSPPMKAVVVTRHGDPSVLEVREVSDPEPRPGEVIVRVRAVAMNHLDVWVRKGLPTLKLELPHVLGADVAGVVEWSDTPEIPIGMECVLAPGTSCGRCRECLSGRDHFCRRYGILGEHRSGGYAERIRVPAANVFAKPANLSFTQAAAVPLVFQTAWQMLVTRAQIRPGEWVLVHAAGSGVGSAGVQIAKLFGATVIATARGAKKLALAKKLGADHVVDYSTHDFVDEVKKLTSKRGVDVVFEHIGKSTWEKSILSLVAGGRLVTCGATSGWDAATDLRYVFYKKLSILGSTMGPKGELFDILKFVERGTLAPVIDTVLPLASAREGHERIERREGFGKVVLEV